MKYKNLILLVVFSLCPSLRAATIDKISSKKNKILLRVDSGEQLSVGDKVCTLGTEGQKVCGRVAQFQGKQPVVEMENLEGVKLGGAMSKAASREIANQNLRRWGLKAGLIEAMVNVEGSAAETTSRTGLGAGVMAEVPVSGQLLFQGELGYGEFGYQTGFPQLKVTHSCIEADLLLKYRIGVFSPLVGVSPAYAITTKAYLSGTALNVKSSDILKPFMVSAVFGLGLSFPLEGSSYLGFDLRYLLGLTNMSPASEGSIKNSAFFLGMTFWF